MRLLLRLWDQLRWRFLRPRCQAKSHIRGDAIVLSAAYTTNKKAYCGLPAVACTKIWWGLRIVHLCQGHAESSQNAKLFRTVAA